MKIKNSQSAHKHVDKITILVKVAFPARADAGKQAITLEYFTKGLGRRKPNETSASSSTDKN